MKIIIAIIGICFFCACERTPLLEVSEVMVGTWVHYSTEGNSHKIVINEDGTGKMEWKIDFKVNRATKSRAWYLDNNELSFGKAAFNGESYIVDKFPQTAIAEIIKFYDTISEGTRYVILDDFYYREE